MIPLMHGTYSRYMAQKIGVHITSEKCIFLRDSNLMKVDIITAVL